MRSFEQSTTPITASLKPVKNNGTCNNREEIIAASRFADGMEGDHWGSSRIKAVLCPLSSYISTWSPNYNASRLKSSLGAFATIINGIMFSAIEFFLGRRFRSLVQSNIAQR